MVVAATRVERLIVGAVGGTTLRETSQNALRTKKPIKRMGKTPRINALR